MYFISKKYNMTDNVKFTINQLLDETILLFSFKNSDIDESIHKARKKSKNIRALLRIIYTGFGKSFFKEDKFYRKNSKFLANARDSISLIEGYNKLSNYYDLKEFDNIYQYLILNQKNKIIDNDSVELFLKNILKGKDRLNKLNSIYKFDLKSIKTGLKYNYKMNKKLMKKSFKTYDSDIFHEWRKFVKHHLYQIEFLTPFDTIYFEQYYIEIKQLSNILGDNQDLSLLVDIIERNIVLIDTKENINNFLLIIQKRKIILQQEAKILGDKIFNIKTKKFLSQIEDYYKKYVI